jgi:hypothetical protein
MNTSLRFDSGYFAVIDNTTDGLFISRKDERFFTAENLPTCYDEVRHLAVRASRIYRKTGRTIFRMTHKGFRAIVQCTPYEILVDTSVEGTMIGNFWFANKEK